MTEKCPVCGKMVSANENKCSECGFTQLHKTFISKIDAEEWIEKVVKPYKTKYEEEKNKPITKNIVQNNNKELQTLQFDNGTYTGNVLDGRRHGKGKYTFNDGRVYDGEWKNDKQEGYAIFKWPSGEVYEGQFLNGEMHGKGKYIFNDGRIYDGDWWKGKQDGNANFKWPDGSTYNGQFSDGKIQGKGKYIWPHGDVYEGQFLNGKMHGNGTYWWSNSEKYDGEWRNDKRHGYGTMTNKNGHIIYKGYWENGERKINNHQNLNKQSPANTNNKAQENHLSENLAILLGVACVGFVVGALIGGSASTGFGGMLVGVICLIGLVSKG